MLKILKRPVFWLIAFVLIGGGGAFVAYKQVTGGASKAQAAPVMPADNRYVTIANGKADVEGGVISVAARRSGIVREVYVQEGDLVKKDQILARQEDDEPRLAHAMSLAQLEQAKSQLASTNVQLEAARRELARTQTLFERGAGTQQQVDQGHDRIRQLEATLAAQQASIAVAQAGVNESAYALELTIVRSPVDGRIIRRYANPGAGASTLNVSNMFDIEPDAPRIVRAEVVEAAIPGITVGQAIEIVPESDADKAYPGKVLRRAGLYGARKLSSDSPQDRVDDRVVEVVVSANGAPLLIGQRVMVRFLKPGTPSSPSAPPPAVAGRTPSPAPR